MYTLVTAAPLTLCALKTKVSMPALDRTDLIHFPIEEVVTGLWGLINEKNSFELERSFSVCKIYSANVVWSLVISSSMSCFSLSLKGVGLGNTDWTGRVSNGNLKWSPEPKGHWWFCARLQGYVINYPHKRETQERCLPVHSCLVCQLLGGWGGWLRTAGLPSEKWALRPLEPKKGFRPRWEYLKLALLLL